MKLDPNQWARARVYDRLSEYTFRYLFPHEIKEIIDKTEELITEFYEKDKFTVVSDRPPHVPIKGIKIEFETTKDGWVDKATVTHKLIPEGGKE